MKAVKSVLPIFLIAFCFLLGCQKELSSLNEFVPYNTSPNISMNVAGRVTDEQGKPVQGAQIIGLNGTAVTNINGEFSLKNVSAYDQAAYIQVKKNGFFTGSRTYVASQGQTHYIEVELLSNATSGSVNAATGGTVSIASGASVTLPANGVVTKASNTAYTGTVNVAVKWIDPTSDALPRQMPGDLRGINENNAEMGLQSFGMLAVELTGASGEALQVATGKMAGLKFPVPASILATAPTTIPLWSFNETNGLWKYEGTATKNGSNYEGQVSHFSFWNCDAQFPVVDFKATIKDQNGNPIKHAMVKIKRTAPNSATYGYTDTMGVVKGKIPKNEALVLEVYMPYNACNTVLHTQNIGPFAAAASINVTVTLTAATAATITGNVINCTGGTVTGGLVEMVLGNRIYRSHISATGTFSFFVNMCGATQTATLLAIDSATNQQGTATTITINTGANAAGTLTACGTSSAQFINYTFNGVAEAFLPPNDSLNAYSNTAQGGTQISGFSITGGTSNFRELSFGFNGFAIGTFPLTSLNLRSGNNFAGLVQSSPINVTVTEYGTTAGSYIAGNFSGMIGDSLTANKAITCTFRVRRQ